ncbi:MAG: CHAT domain-containing tetratricopeptide repeat protein [Crocinitomicaceae bacterium]
MKLLGILIFLFSIQIVNAQKPPSPEELWATWENDTVPPAKRARAYSTFIWYNVLYVNPDSAFKMAEIEYEFAEKHELEDFKGNALNMKAMALQLMFKYEESIAFMEKSIEVYQKAGHERNATVVYGNLAYLYQLIHDYDKTLALYQEVLKRGQEKKEGNLIRMGISGIARVLIIRGNYSEASRFIETELKKEINPLSSIDRSRVYSTLSEAYSHQGKFDKSIELSQEAFRVMDSLQENDQLAAVANNLGVNYEKTGQFEKAEEMYNISYNIHLKDANKRKIVHALHNIAGIMSHKKEYSQSLEIYKNCLEIENLIRDAGIRSRIYENMGSCYRNLNEFDSSVIVLDSSLQIAKNARLFEQIIATYMDLMMTHFNFGKLNEANEYSDKLIKERIYQIKNNFGFMSEDEKFNFFRTMGDDFHTAYNLAAKEFENSNKAKERSYDVALFSKGILLKSSALIRQIILSSGDPELIQSYEDWIAQKRMISKGLAVGIDVSEMEKKAEEIEKKLAFKSQQLQEVLNVQNLSWKKVRDHLKDNEIAIEIIQFRLRDFYTRLNDSSTLVYAALIINKNSQYPEFVKLFNSSELEEFLKTHAGTSYEQINNIYGTSKKPNSKLYELIWQPIEPYVKKGQKIYLSPDGLLHKISFPSISKEKDLYLNEIYDLEVLSSTGKLVYPEKTELTTESKIALFGGIQYSTQEEQNVVWDYLEGTKTEVQEIQKILKEKAFGSEVYSASEASEEAFKRTAESVNYLHIATHGFFFPDMSKSKEDLETEYIETIAFRGSNSLAARNFVNTTNPMMRSGLVFAGANKVWSDSTSSGDDGVLTADEVGTLDLRKSNLIVLSACETGLGEIRESEGVYGLKRSFKLAGAKYLIISLWQVPDKETSEFMTRFYEHLTVSGEIKSSFHKTQKEMSEKYDPYFWGAFVLIE